MKYILFAIVIFFTSFSHEYQEKFVCHTIIEKPGLETCVVVVIKADSIGEAIIKFESYIKRKEIELGEKQKDRRTYSVTKLKDAIMIEP